METTKIELTTPMKYIMTFVGAALAWLFGFVGGGAIISSAELVAKPEHAVIAWGIILAIALIACASTIAVHIYVHN